LRGTAFDIFGYTAERKGERALLAEYEAAMLRLARELSRERQGLALRLASWPDQIRGFGHVRERHLQQARPVWEAAWQQW
jgi:indolepyruvate ferredoxin oxidoreductase